MQQNNNTPPPFAALVFPKLGTPTALETIRDARAQELENFFAPVIEFCDRQQADDNLSQADFKHVFALRQAIDALLAYDEATEKLLIHYRAALTEGQRIAAQLVPSVEEALGLPPAPQPDGPRAADPIYRLGWFRGYNLAQRQYEAASHLYAKRAILPPPTPQPDHDELVARVSKTIATLSLPFSERPFLPLPNPNAKADQI